MRPGVANTHGLNECVPPHSGQESEPVYASKRSPCDHPAGSLDRLSMNRGGLTSIKTGKSHEPATLCSQHPSLSFHPFHQKECI